MEHIIEGTDYVTETVVISKKNYDELVRKANAKAEEALKEYEDKKTIPIRINVNDYIGPNDNFFVASIGMSKGNDDMEEEARSALFKALPSVEEILCERFKGYEENAIEKIADYHDRLNEVNRKNNCLKKENRILKYLCVGVLAVASVLFGILVS